MSSRDFSRGLSRRQALLAGGAALGAVALGGRIGLARDETPGRYGPFKMGVQSYSLRNFRRDEALAKTKELGLHYWEAYSGHIPADPTTAAAERTAAAAAGVEVIGFGVHHFTKDLEANRKVFAFARAMGLGYLSADPDPDAFDVLDKMTEEYGVAIGIHPHGPGHRWASLDAILAAIKDHSPKIGLCNDTGHILRSGLDPVEAVAMFGKRTYGVHLKDVKDAKTFTILGEGDLKLDALLQALAKIGYKDCLALEYEENPANPIPDIKACLDAVAKSVAKLKA